MQVKYKLIGLTILAVFSSCKKDVPVFSIQNESQGRILILGHGGMGNRSIYPMNSEASLNKCLSINAQGVEMDIRQTADGTLIVFHDENFNKATGFSGEVSSTSIDQVRSLTYKGLLRNLEVLVLEDFLKSKKNAKHHFTFDCKFPSDVDSNQIINFGKEITRLIKVYQLELSCYLETTSPMFLEWLNHHHPTIRSYYYCNKLSSAVDLYRRVKFYGLIMDVNLINALQRDSMRLFSWHLSLFNVANKSSHRAAIQLQPDCIQSDNIQLTLEMAGNY